MSPPVQPFDVLPALHLLDGKSMDFTTPDGLPPTRDPADLADPIATAEHWIERGARWLHVVDVDATFDRPDGRNRPIIERLARLDVQIQFAGGMRSATDVDWAIGLGIERIMLASLAIEAPDQVARMLSAHGRDRFGLSLSTGEDGGVVTHGWQTVGGLEAITVAVQMHRLGITYATHSRVLPDGTMSGTDPETSSELATLSGMNVLVGGEVRDMDDVVDCYNRPGITGVLIGKALQTGAIELGAALAETRASLAFETGVPYWKAEQATPQVRLRRALARANIREHLPEVEGRHVLDAGGGNGLASLPLAAAGAQVDLVERSRAMLAELADEVASAGLEQRVTAHPIDIRELKNRFADRRFDLVLLHNVVQYSDDWQRLLDACIERLAPDGLLSLVVRNWYAEPYGFGLADTDPTDLPAMLTRERGASRLFETDVRFFSAGFLIDWLAERGVETVADHGLMCRHMLPNLGVDEETYDRALVLETEMGRREPFKSTARYVQIIARRSTA